MSKKRMSAKVRVLKAQLLEVMLVAREGSDSGWEQCQNWVWSVYTTYRDDEGNMPNGAGRPTDPMIRR